MDGSDYWRQRVEAVEAELEAALACQRDEIGRLQRQVADLQHERALLKAATAYDIRAFIDNYVATHPTAAAGPTAGACGPASALQGPAIPAAALQRFLHEYSNGLVPGPENRRKRPRAASLGGPSGGGTGSGGSAAAGPTPTQQRLFRRMLARHRASAHEDDFLEELHGRPATAAASPSETEPIGQD